ncbi:hypothetical protein B0I35DRAFT_73146 [Stachybotrys elegans]|uniref:Uncharacterized protein n=1 Tax=Stachybotrys elegans TaxID=80388 RepID=A0A8K0SIB1_9HYPO|nr:hypothetical protein B0I35DRAFT_73146 [Stachybotrys elegans]
MQGETWKRTSARHCEARGGPTYMRKVRNPVSEMLKRDVEEREEKEEEENQATSLILASCEWLINKTHRYCTREPGHSRGEGRESWKSFHRGTRLGTCTVIAADRRSYHNRFHGNGNGKMRDDDVLRATTNSVPMYMENARIYLIHPSSFGASPESTETGISESIHGLRCVCSAIAGGLACDSVQAHRGGARMLMPASPRFPAITQRQCLCDITVQRQGGNFVFPPTHPESGLFSGGRCLIPYLDRL